MNAGLVTDRWKLSVNDYVTSAHNLHFSMLNGGFNPRCPVPIDPDGELLNGSHRVACALSLDIKEIPVTQEPHHVWAPPWGKKWFAENGISPQDQKRIFEDWAVMNGKSVNGPGNG